MKEKKRIISAAEKSSVTEREWQNRKVSKAAALEGIVLLKNNGALPLKGKEVALYGAGARHTVKGGTGSGEVNERYAVSICEGLENAGFKITSKTWLDDYDTDYSEAYRQWRDSGNLITTLIGGMMAPFQLPFGRYIHDEDIFESACDTAIFVVARQAGEGADKRLDKYEFNLSPDELENIETMAKSYKNSILVINSGSYMDLGGMDDLVSAVIFYCQQGMEGGSALADILSGKCGPSGKLTDSWATTYADIPYGEKYSYLSGKGSKEYYREGIYVGYRYYDTFKVKPRYSFGFGLSYTDFDVVCSNVKLEGKNICLEAEVINKGGLCGRETVQVYVSAPEGGMRKEYQRLAGFAKTKELAPGESEKLEIAFPLDYLASFSEDSAEMLLEAGDYIVRLGNSSANTKPAAVLTLDKTAVTARLANKCQPEQKIGELRPNTERDPEILPDDIIRISVKAEEISCFTASYGSRPEPFDLEIRSLLYTMSDEDLTDMCVGEGNPGANDTSGIYTPGAVGRTCGRFAAKGIPNVNLADGPAGLRLLKVSALNPDGKLKYVGGNFAFSFLEKLPGSVQKLVSAGKNDDVLYQFTSSFPVGTALAQTWNVKLMEDVGEAVSMEMDEYAVSFWLAPAMNIHRNPLCGRNFEYLSEDPVLTGKIAAGLTRGVQSHKGNYVTIKHFACNNAEDNRMRSNSIINERALREIYLRGFEICVKEGTPAAVMTSYNKLNGTYTPNRRDLCTDILRNEWGFKGLVMTDWFSTAPTLARADLAIAAGNDLIMPGTAADKAAILSGLKLGTLTREQLRLSAGRIIRAVLNSSAATKSSE